MVVMAALCVTDISTAACGGRILVRAPPGAEETAEWITWEKLMVAERAEAGPPSRNFSGLAERANSN